MFDDKLDRVLSETKDFYYTSDGGWENDNLIPDDAEPLDAFELWLRSEAELQGLDLVDISSSIYLSRSIIGNGFTILEIVTMAPDDADYYTLLVYGSRSADVVDDLITSDPPLSDSDLDILDSHFGSFDVVVYKDDRTVHDDVLRDRLIRLIDLYYLHRSKKDYGDWYLGFLRLYKDDLIRFFPNVPKVQKIVDNL